MRYYLIAFGYKSFQSSAPSFVRVFFFFFTNVAVLSSYLRMQMVIVNYFTVVPLFINGHSV